MMLQNTLSSRGATETTDDAQREIKISLIAPMYNEELSVGPFLERVSAVLSGIPGISYEVICVNDGSTDRTLQLLIDHRRCDTRVKIIDFARNFGKEAALTAGLDHAIGDVVIPIDADLQHPPEKIPEMLEQWRAGYMVVLARRTTRDTDGILRRFITTGFYDVINALSDVEIPAGVGDFRLMDRRVVDAVKQLRERKRFMKGLFAWTGFPATIIEFEVAPSLRGASTFKFRRLLSFAIDGIFSFSSLPLRLWAYVGAIIAFAALVYGAWIAVRTLFYGIEVPGFASIMVAILGLGGIQLIGIGVLGEYLGRVYGETKQRPIYVVSQMDLSE
jgi:polyisoprenyl-phosphate glycosyltransferase